VIRRTLHTLALAGSLGLCVLLLFVGWQKASDPGTMRDAVLAHRIIPERFAIPASAVVPWVEVAAGFLALTLLLTAPTRRWGAAILFVVFAALAGYLALVWMNPPPKPAGCGCGLSTAPVTEWFPLVLRNTGMALLPLFLVALHPRSTRQRLST
jgi:hypothetical protein